MLGKMQMRSSKRVLLGNLKSGALIRSQICVLAVLETGSATGSVLENVRLAIHTENYIFKNVLLHGPRKSGFFPQNLGFKIVFTQKLVGLDRSVESISENISNISIVIASGRFTKYFSKTTRTRKLQLIHTKLGNMAIFTKTIFLIFFAFFFKWFVVCL